MWNFTISINHPYLSAEENGGKKGLKPVKFQTDPLANRTKKHYSTFHKGNHITSNVDL